MANTTNKLYPLQVTGTNVNTWGTILNNSIFSIIDANLGATLVINVGGNTNINLTSAQAQNLIHDLTGVLTGNIQYIFPALGGFYTINNQTTGAFTVTVAVVGGGPTIVATQGATTNVTIDAIGLAVLSQSNAIAPAAAGTLTGTTLAANVVNSSLTSVGTLISGVWNGTPIPIPFGGLGTVTLPAHNLIVGNGTSAPNFLAPGASGNVPTSNGTDWVSSPPTSGNLTGPVTSIGNATSIASSINLPGSPTTTTQTTGDNSTKIATTAFVTAMIAIATSGGEKTININGTLIKIGSATAATSAVPQTVNFQTPFPNTCDEVFTLPSVNTGGGDIGYGSVTSNTSNSFTTQYQCSRYYLAFGT